MQPGLEMLYFFVLATLDRVVHLHNWHLGRVRVVQGGDSVCLLPNKFITADSHTAAHVAWDGGGGGFAGGTVDMIHGLLDTAVVWR